MPNNINELKEAIEKIEDGQSDAPIIVAGLESDVEKSNPESYREIRWKAMDLLSRREHSRKELSRKLIKRFEDQDQLVASILDELQQRHLQSESRFTEAYVNMRKKKGFGPVRIAHELKERGVADNLAVTEINRQDHDWFATAEMVWKKKFNNKTPDNLKELAKQQRFLNYRGFDHGHISTLYYQAVDCD